MPSILHNGRLSEQKVIETYYSIASVRIHIERFFARLKNYGIHIVKKITIDILLYIDDIVHNC